MELKNNQQTRRNFLLTAGVISGGVLVHQFMNPFVVFAAAEPNADGFWYGIGIDITKCIGCGLCAKSCKQENDVPAEPFYFRSWVERYVEHNDHTVEISSPNGGIDGFPQAPTDDNVFKSFFVPKMCNHCYKSPCTQVCPVGATFETKDGVVLVDENYCIGCGYCVQACPYGCRYIHPVKKVADKCSFCYHRLKNGLNPACMDNCPTHARLYGNLNDPESELVKYMKENNVLVLKPNLNTGSKLYYNSLSQHVR